MSYTTSRVLAGTIILDETLNWIVIVKGKTSKKWGLPKGHIESGEEPILAAMRETFEETGIRIRLLVDVLPCILSKRAKLFLISLNREKTKLDVKDTREISEARWIPINMLQELPNQTRMLRGIKSRISYIRAKINNNKINYHMIDTNTNEFVLNKYLFYYLIKNYNKSSTTLIKNIHREFKGVFYEPELQAAIDKVMELCKNNDLKARFDALLEFYGSKQTSTGWEMVSANGKNATTITLSRDIANIVTDLVTQISS